MIELRYLEQIAAFERCGTLRKAAEELHISQPALSQSFQNLEAALGTVLFVRSRRNRIELAENGKLLAEYAHRILSLEKELEQELARRKFVPKTLRIAASAPAPLWQAAAAARALYPDTEVEEKVSSSPQDLLCGLIQGSYDLIISHERPEEDGQICSFAWCTEQLALAVPESHPLAAKTALHLEDLAEQSVILYEDIGFWNDWVQSSIPFAFPLRASKWNSFAQAASSGLIPYFISGWNDPDPDEKIRIVPFDPPVEAQYWISCRKRWKQMLLPLLQKLQQKTEILQKTEKKAKPL